MPEIAHTRIRIGLEKPLTVFHMTDTHITLVDERDSAEKHRLAESRREAFGDTDGKKHLSYLKDMIAFGMENADLIAFTGDLYDFISHANLECAGELLQNGRILFCPGNHEYTEDVFGPWEDNALRMNAYMKAGIREAKLLYSSRVVGGVDFVAMDNVFYRFTPWQLARLKADAAKGFPMVLLMHNPLFDQSLYDIMMERTWRECAFLVGCDEEHILPYTEYCAAQQRPDRATMDMIDYINGETRIKAILAGHVHIDHECVLPDGAIQIVTAGGFMNRARIIDIE